MTNYYTNLPPQQSSKESTIQAIDTFYSKPIEISVSVYDAMQGFFTSRGFETSSAEVISLAIIKQARVDGYNPMELLDNFKGLSSVELTNVVSEILNYNRYKTSFLGYSQGFSPSEEINRNILP